MCSTFRLLPDYFLNLHIKGDFQGSFHIRGIMSFGECGKLLAKCGRKVVGSLVESIIFVLSQFNHKEECLVKKSLSQTVGQKFSNWFLKKEVIR